MALARYQPRQNSQPQQAAEIDWQHPMARSLEVLASGEMVITPGGRRPITIAAGSPRIAPSAIGIGPTFVGGAQGYKGGATARYPATEGFTLELLCQVTAPGGVGFVGVVAAYAGESKGIISFFGGNIVYWDGNVNINTGVPWRTDGSPQHVFMASASGNGSPLLTYLNGELIHTSGNLTSLVTPNNDPVFRVGDFGVGWNQSMIGTIAKAAYYRRGLVASEVASLTRNPWQIYKPRSIWVPVSVAGAANLAAAPAASASATGALTTGIRLAASATTAASASGALSTAVRLAATAASASAAAASLSASIRLACNASAGASASASLLTDIRLAATATASASGTAALNTAPAGLAAQALAQASATASLSASIRLAAQAICQASATATLSTPAQLAATAIAQASASGALTTGIRLAAAAACQASCTAALFDASATYTPAPRRFVSSSRTQAYTSPSRQATMVSPARAT